VGAGVAVNWSASLGELSAAASGTDANSQATVVLTAPAVVGTALVTATAAKGDAGKTVSVGFAVDAQRARVAALTSSKTSGLADGADTVTLTATVDDGRGNPVGRGRRRQLERQPGHAGWHRKQHRCKQPGHGGADGARRGWHGDRHCQGRQRRRRQDRRNPLRRGRRERAGGLVGSRRGQRRGQWHG
jgi:hypothetical protein